MPIDLPREVQQPLIASIKRFFAEQMDEEIGDLKAGFLLEFCLREIGPSVYNRAITDAQAYIQERTLDLGAACYEPEFGYWTE